MSKKIKLDKTEENKEEVKETIQPDPSIEAMSKEEALEYFKLPEWASREDLDNQFWKLGKMYKAQKDEQKLADIACAYNIATGERDRKEAEQKEEETAKHYFGKTKKQWQTFWHYEWVKFVIAAAVLVGLTAFLKEFVFAPRVDFRVAAIGNIEQDPTILYDYLTENKLCKEADVGCACIVSENEDGFTPDQSNAQVAVGLIAVYPDLLVFDAPTAPTYVYGQNMLPLDEMYEEMKATWTPEQLAKIQPYVYSRAKFIEEYADGMPEIYREDLDELVPSDYEEHIYGFIVLDELDQKSLGYTVRWKESDKSLILAVNAAGDHVDHAKEVLSTMLINLDAIQEDYVAHHPFVQAESEQT